MENNQDNIVLNGDPVEKVENQPQGDNPQNGAPVNPCPICGTPYTYVCPKCGFSPYVGRKNTKKNIFSKWWFWLVAVLLVFAIMIGSASCMVFLMTTDSTDTSSYTTQPLCSVGDLEIKLIPELCTRDEYDIIFTIEVKNNGDKDVSFYPTKAKLDYDKARAYVNYSIEDSGYVWNSGDFADDGSVIIKAGKSNLLELDFDLEDEDYNEEFSVDYRSFEFAEFYLNVADSKSLSVIASESIAIDLGIIEAKKQYYEYE